MTDSKRDAALHGLTPEEWDQHWFRIREGHLNDGHDERAATAMADLDTADQFGPRPQEKP